MKAISPVIATVIIVSVAIAISIAVALWLTGITSGFTQTENLQIVSAYATWNDTLAVWNVTLTVKNTGTTAATIDNIFINNKPITISSSESYIGKVINITKITIDPGEQSIISIYLTNYTATNTNQLFSSWNIPSTVLQALSGYTHGQMVNIKIHTASGRDYPVTITLP